jgi:CubicO group peptidase (beta-lactamase class C family)
LLVALLASETHELAGAGDDRAALRGAADAHAEAAAELQQTFLAQRAQRAQNRVRVHLHDRREVTRRGQAFTRFRLAVGDRASDLPGDLIVQRRRVSTVDALQHCASYGSITDITGDESLLRGVCDARFAPVREALAANLQEEIGAAVVVYVGGEVVVDLCGGWADAARTRPWTPDTVVDVFSCGKGFVALTVLSLGLDLDASAWQDATLRQVLAHQAGHPALRVDVPPDAIYDWDWMVRALESQEPWWVAGTAHGYHVNTFGFICGEVVRRATGEPLRSRFARLAGDAAGVTFGAPPGVDLAEFVFDLGSDTPVDGTAEMSEARRQLLARVYLNPPGLSGLGTVNSAAWRAAEIPSANCHASARGIAAVYARMPELLGSDLLAEATRPWSDGHDFVLDRHTRFGLGFQLTQPDRPMGTGERTYGHFGAGGSLGFHDPDADVIFAYVCNRCEGRRWQTTRNRRLLDGLSASL